ncbi:MAG: PH domain-containing protein [Kineosporiaceae bacterium]
MSDIDPFRPEGVDWTPVSRRLIGVRMVSVALSAAVLAVVIVVVAVVVGTWQIWLALGLPLASLAWSAVLVPARVRSWGYAEREEDLMIKRGVLFRALTVVPYGRMQYVDVNAGPLDRLFGVATVQLHTASAATDATIPGLVPAEAARLRDRLTARGRARLAGL